MIIARFRGERGTLFGDYRIFVREMYGMCISGVNQCERRFFDMNGNLVGIACENNGANMMVEWGTRLSDIIRMLPEPDLPYLAAYVNNDIKELDYMIYEPVSVRFIDITHFEGIRVYQRTLFFTLQKAVHDLFPGRRFRIPHSVSKGFYCEIEGLDEVSQEDVDRLKARMNDLIAQDIPIARQKVLASEAKEVYTRLGFYV